MLMRLCGFAAALTAVFGGMIGLVRSQAYDDPDMREFLLPPPGCDAPCFLGVQPGTTTLREAERIFRQNQWTQGVSRSAQFYDLLWTGAQPGFVDDTAPNYFMAEANRVGQMRLRTTLRLGDVVVVLGKPDAIYSRSTTSGVFHTIIYTRLGLEISGFAPCSARHRDVWQIPVEIRMHELAFESIELPPNVWRWGTCI